MQISKCVIIVDYWRVDKYYEFEIVDDDFVDFDFVDLTCYENMIDIHLSTCKAQMFE